jgi:prepilin-type N-terminal cleavage/methylation domain-containing protein
MDGTTYQAGFGSGHLGRRGYTLVEVLVAVSILSIVLIGIMAAINVAQDTQDRAMNIAAARDIAVSRLETYRNLSPVQFGTVPASDISAALPTGNSIACSVASYGGTNTFIYRATVSVSWPEGKGSRTVSYESLLYKP